MEQYKLINAELMDQVQKQRIQIGEMCKTEVFLKKQLLEEREMRLANEQHNENKLKSAIRTLLQSLDINLDSSIDSASSARTSQLSLEANRQSTCSREEVCSELRRSSALLRRTLVMSPSRKSRSQGMSSVNTCNISLVEQKEEEDTTANEEQVDEDVDEFTIPTINKEVRSRETLQPRRLAELQTNMSSPDSPEAQEPVATSLPDQTNSSQPTGVAIMYSTIEECDSDDDTLSLDDDTDTELSIEVSPLPLRDVTNRTSSAIERTTLHSESPKAYRILRFEENEIENCSQEMRRSSRITIERGRQTRRHLNNQEQSSIEHVRCAPEHTSPMHLTVPHSSMDSVTATLTPSRSQLNFSSFNGIENRPNDFSTPERNEKVVGTKRKPSARTKPTPKPTRNTDGEESSLNSSVSSRPIRSCRPTSLKEISCRTKLRNDGQRK